MGVRILNQGLDFFILGLIFWGIWMFRHPDRAKRGNMIAAIAMVMAAGIVLFSPPPCHPYVLSGALLIGSLAGVWVVSRINMLQIPSMVAFQNGAGGFASFLIAFVQLTRGAGNLSIVNEISGLLGLAMGAFTLSGSIIAAGKLANRLNQPPVELKHHTLILGSLFLMVTFLISIGLAASLALPLAICIWVAIILASAVFGILFAIRVGGADMPVQICRCSYPFSMQPPVLPRPFAAWFCVINY
ncbi:MAG: NAD(P)(+) transhydrogenase (Re/Si-specific) subunit beta [Desulfobacter sp.]|nr:NAD(P)(+) transhydrogenase (Re/Si-specific) subunit beta [Desulfobacter sp.]